MAGEIKYVEFEGTRENIGLKLGSYFRVEIQTIVAQDENLRTQFRPFYNTQRGKQCVQIFLQKAQDYFPEYVQELRGYAEGAEVDFMSLFLLHLEVEICTIIGANPEVQSEGCTTIMVHKGDMALMGHTEDLLPLQTKYSHLAKYRILDGDKKVENFTFAIIPGLFPGNTTGFNAHGLAMAQNIVFQDKINMDGIPRRFINRAMIKASSISDMKSIISNGPGPSAGFCTNVAEKIDNKVKMSSLEVIGSTANGACIYETLVDDVYYILNEYKNAQISFIREPSTPHRDKVLCSFLFTQQIASAEYVLTILSDTSNTQYPVYRNGADPDYLSTFCVSLFDLTAGRVDFYGNKPLHSTPTHSFEI